MRGLTRFLSGVLTLAFIVMVISAGGLVWFQHAVHAPGPLTSARNVKIPAGDSPRMIAERLEQQGVINGPTVFLAHVMAEGLIGRVSGVPSKHMKAGEYEIPAGSSIRDVIKKLTEGRSLLYAVTLPEGLTSHEIVRRLITNPELSGEIGQVPAEGTLLPETLKVPRSTPRAYVLSVLAKEQAKYLEEQWAKRAPDLPVRSKEEALVLASIIEKESGPKDDPARVAGVFVNRLKRGMRLQSDPTILYGKHGAAVDWGAKIFRSDIARKTDYNTYQIDGLPPTPICNPGRRSIAAALNPAETKDLYFVANGQGGHIFSETLKDHENAVKNWRKIEREIRADEATEAKAGQAAPAAAGVAATLINTKPGSAAAQGTLSVADRSIEGGAVPLPVKRPKPKKR